MLLDIINGVIITVISSYGISISPCPQQFDYLINFDKTIGLITLDRLPEGLTEVRARFLQSTPLPQYIPDKPIIRHVELINKTVQIGIEFDDSSSPPVLDKLYVNGTVVCSGYHTIFSYMSMPFTFTLHANIINSPESSKKNDTTDQRIPADVRAACGLESGSQYIYGGTQLKLGEFPWKVALFVVSRDQETRQKYSCGGSLISARSIVTAAHCVLDGRGSDLIVYLGRHDLQNSEEPYAIERAVEKYIVHPDYQGTTDGDIAIMYVADVGSFNAFLHPVCLWDENMKTSAYIGKKATLVGWGAVQNHHTMKPIAKRVDLMIVTNSECIREDSNLIYEMSDRSMCAGNLDGNGPCIGDSGSGLVLQINNRWTLRGVTSYAVVDADGCDLYTYAVYVDVSKYLDWLLDNFV